MYFLGFNHNLQGSTEETLESENEKNALDCQCIDDKRNSTLSNTIAIMR